MSLKKFSPVRLLVLGYITLIVIGAVLLLLPFSHNGPLSLVDAIFTSTSALCVTGLIVKDTATFYTFFGKLVILVLIQIGGLGYMTFATIILFFLKKRGSLTMRMTMAESFPELTLARVFVFAKRVVLLTLAFELLGTGLLAIGLKLQGFTWLRSFEHAVFLSISGFCNAGFATFSDSLISLNKNPFVVLTIAFLLIAGGVGFVVHEDLYFRFLRKTKRKLFLHTKVVLFYSAIFLVTGTIVIFLAEYLNKSQMGFWTKLMNAFFMAATPRTAGFSTVNLTSYHVFTLLFIVMLMAIGGSPGGTAGGMKTSTVVGVYLWVVSIIKGKEKPTIFGYSIPLEPLKRAVSIMVLGLTTIILGTWLLTLTEKDLLARTGIIPLFFEEVSAFGTVGLSLGSLKSSVLSLSADFSVAGKWIIIITMLIGRAGVLSIAAFLVEKKRELIKRVEGVYIVG